MNAVVSANTLDWRASAAYNPELAMPDADPMRIYRFTGRCTLDRAFRRRITRDPRAVFEEHGFGEVSSAANVRNLDRKLQLGRRERSILRAVASRTCVGEETCKVAMRPIANTLIFVFVIIPITVILVTFGPPHQDE
jgi:hypothetical protein